MLWRIASNLKLDKTIAKNQYRWTQLQVMIFSPKTVESGILETNSYLYFFSSPILHLETVFY